MQTQLAPLATAYFTRYLIAHTGHHLVTGPTRFADHEHLGTLYHAYNDAFDQLLEIADAMGEKFRHAEIFTTSAKIFSNAYKADELSNAFTIFSELLSLETRLRQMIDEALDNKPDTALRTVLESLAADSLTRSTHLRARIS